MKPEDIERLRQYAASEEHEQAVAGVLIAAADAVSTWRYMMRISTPLIQSQYRQTMQALGAALDALDEEGP